MNRYLFISLAILCLFSTLFLPVLAFLIKPAKMQSETWIVTSVADSGRGTLRGCLQNATVGDTVTFDSSVFPPTSPVYINLTSELPHIIQGNLTIDASGAGVILNGNQTPTDTAGLFVDSENNTIKGLQILYFPGCGIMLTANAHACSISGNKIALNTNGGISLYDSSNNSIYGNNIATNYENGIYLSSSSNNVIAGNTVASNKGHGIYLNSSSNSTLMSNTASDNENGIYLSGSSNNTLTGNNASLNNRYGVILSGSSNNTLTGNNASNNEWGIYQDRSSNNTLTGNIASSNNGYGIFLLSSSNNTLTDNTASSNNLNGIRLADSSNNTLTGNIASSNNGYGIFLWHSNNNTLFHNNFINNTKAVDNHDSINTWDDGYPSGGNYWSNYTDVDQYSGQYQNETGSDGIWDTPYYIDENNQDNYPIVPEFSTWTPMLLILVPLTVAMAVYKRRPLKTPLK